MPAVHGQRGLTRKQRPSRPRHRGNYDTARFSSQAGARVKTTPAPSLSHSPHQHRIFIIQGPLRPKLAVQSGPCLLRSLRAWGRGVLPASPAPSTPRGGKPPSPAAQSPRPTAPHKPDWGCWLLLLLLFYKNTFQNGRQKSTHIATSLPNTVQPPDLSESTSNHLRTENRTPQPHSSPPSEDPDGVSCAH